MTDRSPSSGPLAGLRVIEIAGIGPGPFAAMMLADHGAEVIAIERPGGVRAGSGLDPMTDILRRSRRSIALDLKSQGGRSVLRKLLRNADGLIEGFRPGVMERLGLGPDIALSDNPHLVYGRVTGWGQHGSLADTAGHDINYIAIAGVLGLIGDEDRGPIPPLNLIADFGGGGMMLAFGMVAAMLHARNTGEGQVVDCAMTDGAALLASMIWSNRAAGRWNDRRCANTLDGGAHFYGVYRAADGYLAIGAIEPAFYARFLETLGLDGDRDFHRQRDEELWPELKRRVARVIATRTRDEWVAIFSGIDACVSPVLDMGEALEFPHNRERGTFVEIDGLVQPAPAPRYSRTSLNQPSKPVAPGSDRAAILSDLGMDEAEIRRLEAEGAFG
ncbi:CaiB/BaiF CoA-transferase family protein [Sphingobium sp.]|uniref:CaiB/BaiF CoA transferase family protein n=1 Tax=Sphingobium sp. TaxID=1912891 RepID=UPI0028BD9771|nr:CaiB/BaiF CoA-transferase family protein [Sphingobium sp.]